MPSVTVIQRDKLNRDPITDPHVILLEFQEDGRSTVHRAAINNEDITHNSNTYVATDISIALPGSSDGDGSVHMEMSNISRIIGVAILQAKRRIGCRIKLIDTSEPDVALLDTKNLFVLSQANGDSVRITADLGPRATVQEPVPFRRTSRAFYPGLFFSK